MRIHKALTTVTPLSKYLALSLFVILPILTFFLGIRYSELKYVDIQPDVVYTRNDRAEITSLNSGAKVAYEILDLKNGWKLYKDNVYGYQIEIPSNWYFIHNRELNNMQPSVGETVTTASYDMSDNSNYDISLHRLSDKVIDPGRVEIGASTQKRSLSQMKKAAIHNVGSTGSVSEIKLESELNVNSAPMLKIENKELDTISYSFLNNKSYVFNIHFLYIAKNPRNTAIYNRILLSFKFLN